MSTVEHGDGLNTGDERNPSIRNNDGAPINSTLSAGNIYIYIYKRLKS